MKKQEKQEKSCGAVVYRNGEKGLEILLIQHKNGGHWAFPKGHVEKKETEEETARREIREETGLKVELDTGFRAVTTYSPKPNVMKDVIYFAACAKKGEWKAQEEEILKICWEMPESALDMVTYESDKEILRKFLAYREEISQ